MKSVYQAIAKVTRAIGSIAKEGKNDFQGYKYVTAADVLKKVQPLAMDAGLIIIRGEVAKEVYKGPEGDVLAITYEYTVGSEETGETLPDKPKATGAALLFNKKGIPDDKAANKCGTAADKYFFISLFKIPTVDADDADACDGSGAKAQSFDNPYPPRQTAEVKPLTVVTNTPRAGDTPDQIAARYKKEPVDKISWVEWIQETGSAIHNAKSNAEIDAIVKARKEELAFLEKNNPKAWDRIFTNTKRKREELPKEAPADDLTIPGNLDRRPSDDQYIESVDALFAAQATVEELDAVWADNEKEVLEKSRATRDRIAECYEAHVRRVKNAA